MVSCRPVLENLQQPFHFDEVVALESVHHFGDVVPHLGVHVAGAVAQQQRKVGFARFLLPDVFPMHQESGGEHLVRLQIADEGRFHELDYCDELVDPWWCAGNRNHPQQPLVLGMLATSALLMVSGLSCAGSTQEVSLPAAAPRIHIIGLDLEKGLFAQLGEIVAHQRAACAAREFVLYLVLHFSQLRLAGFLMFFNAKDQKPALIGMGSVM